MVSTKRSTVANATNSSIEIIVPSGKLSGFDFRDWLKVKPGDLDSSFSLAVRAAIKAYAETGRMVNAALAYAAHGIPVFPLSIHSKAPIPARDKDANGEPIPGTGGFKKATTDPEQIRKWWWKNKRHLIGIPM